MYKKLLWAGVLSPLMLTGCPVDSTTEETSNGTDPALETSYVETFSADGLRRAVVDVDEAAVESLQQAHHRYALEHYREFSSTEENFISSPFEQQQFLGTLALGAEGTTLDHLSTLLEFDAGDVEQHALMSDLSQKVEALSSVTQHRYLWGQEGYLFATQFLDKQAEFYGPVMAALDFKEASTDSREAVVDTFGESLDFSAINSESRFVLGQQGEFRADWSADLSVESVQGRFAVLGSDENNDSQRQVDMLRVEGLMNVVETEDYRAVELPLNESGLSMLMVMPALGKFSNIDSYFNESFVHTQLDDVRLENTVVMIPQFSAVVSSYDEEMPDLGVALVGPQLKEIDGRQDVASTEPKLEGSVLLEADYSNPDAIANFSRVNHVGYLYADKPKNHIEFSVNEQGVSSQTSHSISHQASLDEPQWLFQGIANIKYGGISNYGIYVSTSDYFSHNIGFEKPCFYEPDQRPFLFAVYDKNSDAVLHLGHVVSLAGDAVAADWTTGSYVGAAPCGDSPLVTVYRYTEGLKCESSGMTRESMVQILSDAGIDVLPTNGYDYDNRSFGIVALADCGNPNDAYETFSIRENKLSQAQSLGFDLLSEKPAE